MQYSQFHITLSILHKKNTAKSLSFASPKPPNSFQNPYIRNHIRTCSTMQSSLTWFAILDNLLKYIQNGLIFGIPICETILLNPTNRNIRYWIFTNERLKVQFMHVKEKALLIDLLQEIIMRKPLNQYQTNEIAGIAYFSSEYNSLLSWDAIFKKSKQIVGIQIIKIWSIQVVAKLM